MGGAHRRVSQGEQPHQPLDAQVAAHHLSAGESLLCSPSICRATRAPIPHTPAHEAASHTRGRRLSAHGGGGGDGAGGPVGAQDAVRAAGQLQRGGPAASGELSVAGGATAVLQAPAVQARVPPHARAHERAQSTHGAAQRLRLLTQGELPVSAQKSPERMASWQRG